MNLRFQSILALLFLLNLHFAAAQAELKLIETFELRADYFKADHLGNIYTINGSTLSRYTHNGDFTFEYTNSAAGDLSSVDVSDPLRILLFFKDQRLIILLNQQLAEITDPIYLDDLEFYNVPAVCNTSHNRIWLFDQQNFRLVQLNKDLKVVQHGNSVMSIFRENDRLTQLIEHNNQLYMNVPSRGILVFDQFGSYLKTNPILQSSSISISEDYLLFINKEQEMGIYSLSMLDQYQVKTNNDIGIECAQIINKHIYISDKQKVYEYSFEK